MSDEVNLKICCIEIYYP